MRHREERGFLAMCGYEETLSWTEGLFLLAGAGVAVGFGVAGESRARAEEASIKGLRQRRQAISSFVSDLMSRSKRAIEDDGFDLEEFADLAVENGYNADLINDFPQMVPLIARTFHNPRLGDALKKAWSQSRMWNVANFVRLYRPTETMSEEEIESILKLPEEEFYDRLREREPILNAIGWKLQDLETPEYEEVFERIRRSGLTPYEIGGLERAARIVLEGEIDEDFAKTLAQVSRDYDLGEGYDGSFFDVRRFLHARGDFENLLVLDPTGVIFGGTVVESGDGETIDWDETFERDARWRTIPAETFQRLTIDKSGWIKTWDRAQTDTDLRKKLYALDAVMQAIEGSRLTDIVGGLSENCLVHNTCSQNDEQFIKDLAKTAKSGALRKYDAVLPNYVDYETARRQIWLLANHPEVMGDFSSYIDVANAYHSAKGLLATDFEEAERRRRRSPPEVRMQRRLRDRLAQRDPEWAISNYRHEYERGKRIAPLLKEVVDHLEDLNRKGERVVIHGRDGEMLYDLLKRRQGVDLSRVRYAITSRPLTTFANEIPPSYEDYLGRMVPKGAVHIDTGFQGSIPAWLDQRGYEVKAVRLISANDPREQIPVTIPMSDEKRRDIVLSDLEHSSQRLENPESGWNALEYSEAAPGYHARLYGVLDALKLPRLRVKTPVTRFEERRYRVSSEPGVESEEPEGAVLKAK